VRNAKKRGERGRGGHLSRRDLRNGSYAHDGMRVSLHASGYSCGAAVLDTCSWAMTPYARTKEGVNGPPKKKSVPEHGGAEGDQERRPASFAD